MKVAPKVLQHSLFIASNLLCNYLNICIGYVDVFITHFIFVHNPHELNSLVSVRNKSICSLLVPV